MKSLFSILLIILTFQVNSQWVLDYQFVSNVGIFSMSVIDSSNFWFNTADSLNNRQLYKKYSGNFIPINTLGIIMPNKLTAIDNVSAFLNAGSRRLYKTTNSGINWIVIRDSVLSGYDYSVDKHSPNFIAAGKTNLDSNLSVLYTSTNRGDTWIQQNIPFTTEYIIYNINVQDPAHIYIGMNCPEINCSSLRYIYSTNGGNNWQVKDLPLVSNNMWLSAPVFNIQNITGFLFAPGYNVYRYKTTNSGINWSSAEYFSNGNTEGMHGIKNIDSTSIWFCSTSDIIFKTTNDGINWTQMTIPLNNGDRINDFDFIKVGNKYYGYLGTAKGGIYKFVDNIIPIGIHPISTEIPVSYSLSQNYPNPFNPVTKIRFSLPEGSDVKLIIYDALGRTVKTLVNENLSPGVYETDFDSGELSSGIYYYIIIADNYTETKKMVVIK